MVKFIIFYVALLFAHVNAKVTFCYWGTWSYYGTGKGQFRPSNIDPNLCTHIGYAFFGITTNYQIKSLDQSLDFESGNIANTVGLKKKNPKLKIMASVGGWSEGSKKFSAMASSAARRATFINSTMKFLLQNKFDGVDIDWEFPTQRGGVPADKANFVSLLREFKTALKPHNLLLTLAVNGVASIASKAYDIPKISNNVDLINVMTYDFTGAWDNKANFNAPLEGNNGNNVKAAINYWLQKGAPPSKIVLGMPLYGRSFTLANSSQNKPGSAISGVGLAGPYSNEAGYLGYNEICEKLKSGWTRRWDSTSLVPYAFKGNQWVGYDDVTSIAKKVAFLKAKNLAGAMVWSIENDDFRGTCGEKFPLLKAVKRNLSA